jgi:hypothetical protein
MMIILFMGLESGVDKGIVGGAYQKGNAQHKHQQ